MARMTELGTIYKANPGQAKTLIQMCLEEENTFAAAAKALNVSAQTLKIYCAKPGIEIELETAKPVDTEAFVKDLMAKYEAKAAAAKEAAEAKATADAADAAKAAKKAK